MNAARQAGLPAANVRASRTLIGWRMKAYSRAVAQAVARHAKTLAIIIGIFVFGLPLNAQLDLLGMPMKVLLAENATGLGVASVLTTMSMLAAASVAVQGDTVFGGAARRWSASLPGGIVAHRAADFIVTGAALWPFWIMLAAAIARHVLGARDIVTGPTFALVVATLALVWTGAPLALLARSRAALAAVFAANASLWIALRFGGAGTACAALALACGVVALWRARLDAFVEREQHGATLLRGGSPFELVRAVMVNVYGHSLRLGGLMLAVLAMICGWIVSMPDYLSRHWGIVNVVLPFALYQIAILHGWMRDESVRLTSWLGSLPRAIARFNRAAAMSIVGLSSAYVLAICVPFAIATDEGRRYAIVFACYAGLATALAACRWWGARASRIVDMFLTAGCAIACYGMLK